MLFMLLVFLSKPFNRVAVCSNKHHVITVHNDNKFYVALN